MKIINIKGVEEIMKEKRNKKELIAVSLLVFSLVLITVGATFAFFNYSRQGATENKIQTGTLTFVYDESKSSAGGVSLMNAFPMSDEDGEALDKDKSGVFDFDVRAKTEGAAIHYEIYLTKVAPTDERSELPEKVVKTYLTTLSSDIESAPETTGLPTETNLNLYNALWDSKVPSILEDEDTAAKTLYRETIANGESNYEKHFRYRMWIAEEANQVENGAWIYNNMTFSVKVNVYAQNEAIPDPTEPQEEVEPGGDDPYAKPQDSSGASVPKLVTGMVPVVYDDVDQRWEKASSSDWYDYTKQKWANAVTVTDAKRANYISAEAGEEILAEDINTMWVWIPRYEYDSVSIASYAGGTATKPGAINIKFISKEVTSADTDNYKVHPAFSFGGTELDGFWYGKFETSNEEKQYTTDSSTLTPIIKPNTTSWRNVKVVNMFYAALNMTTAANAPKYGFSSDGSIDTHMSKNSEWGAVAYLSQSIYGKYGNETYDENSKEVTINSCSSYTTGVAACSQTYESTDGQKASTTGNITGVYDMSGGAYEYVMGALNDGNGKPTIKFSGFVDGGNDSNKLPDAKYYDVYTTNLATSCTTNGECYGHALSETAGWYGDDHSFVDSAYPWFERGAVWYDGRSSGVFWFGVLNGEPHSTHSFRLVLTPIGA